jgi:hypothetical protein
MICARTHIKLVVAAHEAVSSLSVCILSFLLLCSVKSHTSLPFCDSSFDESHFPRGEVSAYIMAADVDIQLV